MGQMRWMLDMVAEPIVPSWKDSRACNMNGAELQRAIIKGFSDHGDPLYADKVSGRNAFTFEKVFTFKEHGEFFHGALTMAGVRYAGDFYELLQRYGTIKVTITKVEREE